MKKIHSLLILIILLSANSCSIYNFTGTGKIDAKTFQVNYFPNNAELVQPGLDLTFRLALQDLIQNQTNLNSVTNNADLIYEGEITDYRITPMLATADIKAAQNRLTIRVNVIFTNRKKEADNFERQFEFFYDYPAQEQLRGTSLDNAVKIIFERITQDVFNESLAKW